jgi:biopolymer transport protein TolR
MAMQVGDSGGHDQGGGSMMADINVTPLVDVMLVLLIIFMITAPLMTTGMKVELPRTQAPPLPTAEKQMVISITAEGKYYISAGQGEGHEVLVEELGPKLKAIVESNPEQEVFLTADGKVPYEKVAQLLSLCTQAGVPRMGMVTQPGKPAEK